MTDTGFAHQSWELQDPLEPGPPPAPHSVRRRVVRMVGGVLAVVIGVMGLSYTEALTYPGNASWQSRTTGWVRALGGGFAVNTAENWYYTRNPPGDTVPSLSSLPPSRVAAPAAAVSRLPVLPLLPGVAALPGEGRWVPGRVAADGTPALYTSYFQPDPTHASVVAGVAFIRAGATGAHLVAGTTQPGGSWPTTAQVAASDVSALAATFNSGFKLTDISGGFYANGRVGKPLQAGQASLVISNRGQLSVGQWGRDITMNPHITAVRQNLALIVDGGHRVSGLRVNADHRWGTAQNQLQYTWRSGIGTDRAGNVVYVAGDKLTLNTLATAMTNAGVVRVCNWTFTPGWRSSRPGHPPAVPTRVPRRCCPPWQVVAPVFSPRISATSSTSPSLGTDRVKATATLHAAVLLRGCAYGHRTHPQRKPED